MKIKLMVGVLFGMLILLVGIAPVAAETDEQSIARWKRDIARMEIERISGVSVARYLSLGRQIERWKAAIRRAKARIERREAAARETERRERAARLIQQEEEERQRQAERERQRREAAAAAEAERQRKRDRTGAQITRTGQRLSWIERVRQAAKTRAIAATAPLPVIPAPTPGSAAHCYIAWTPECG